MGTTESTTATKSLPTTSTTSVLPTTTQAAVAIQGSLTLDGMTESVFEEPSVKNAVKSAIASAAGVGKSMVDVSTEQVGRRLEGSDRRLASLMVTYTITTSSDSQADTLLPGLRQNAAAWTASINQQLVQSSSNVRVSVSTVEDPVVVVVPGTSTMAPSESTTKKRDGDVDTANSHVLAFAVFATLFLQAFHLL